MCECRFVSVEVASVTQVEKMREEDFLHHFLIGLDGAYASIRTSLLGQEPLPTLDRAYQQVIQAERLRDGELLSSKDARDSIMAFALQPNTRGFQNGGGTDLAEEGDQVVVEDGQEKEVTVGEGMVHRLSEQIKQAGLEVHLGSKQGTRRGWRVRLKLLLLQVFQQHNCNNFLIF